MEQELSKEQQLANEVRQLCCVVEYAFQTCTEAHESKSDKERMVNTARTLATLTLANKQRILIEEQLAAIKE